ncbi:MAG: class III lanthipeptide [Lachnospiraceae bacterium]
MKEVREKVLNLQKMHAVADSNDTTKSTFSFLCKKESTVSVVKCVV